MSAARPVKVLVVSSHVVQYDAPLYRRYAARPELDLTVAYCSLQGAERGVDPGFGVEVAWDVPLLDGYRWTQPGNRARRPGIDRFFGLCNPGLWSLVRGGGFDVVVCHGYHRASFWIAGAAARASGAALATFLDATTLAPREGGGAKLRAKRLLVPRVLGRAHGVLARSSAAVRFVESLRLRATTPYLVPYVIDATAFAVAAERADRVAVRARWGVPIDAPVALFVGKLVPWKRPQDLLRAIEAAPGWRAVLAGDGSLRASLEAEARSRGLSERVRFLGFVNQSALPETYAASDVLVLPSSFEPFGQVVGEAFACGRPAIVSGACGAAGDLVREGETGFVTRPGDVDAIAAALRRLSVEPALLPALGERARARVAGWGPERNVAAFVAACQDLARRARRAPGGRVAS